jgi:hypothetical protein
LPESPTFSNSDTIMPLKLVAMDDDDQQYTFDEKCDELLEESSQMVAAASADNLVDELQALNTGM